MPTARRRPTPAAPRTRAPPTTPDLPALTTLGGELEITQYAGLVDVELPALETAGMISVKHNDALHRLALPSLTTLTFAYPWQVGIQLWVEDDAALTALELPLLLDVTDGAVWIIDNPGLCEAATTTWAAGLNVPSGTVTITGNDPGC